MLIHLDFESDDAIYRQIKQQIIAGMAKGELQPSEGLPSVRSLAKDIGINLHTVNKAYKQLKQEGFILIHRQKGVVVHPDGAWKADAAYWESLHKATHPLVAEAICRGVEKEEFVKMCEEIYASYRKGDGNG